MGCGLSGEYGATFEVIRRRDLLLLLVFLLMGRCCVSSLFTVFVLYLLQCVLPLSSRRKTVFSAASGVI